MKSISFCLLIVACAIVFSRCKSSQNTPSTPESTITVTDGGPSEPDSARALGDSAMNTGQQMTDSTMTKPGDTTTTQLQETYWKLTELMGKAVPPTPADSKEIHIKFRAGDTMEGFGGCNGLGGAYELKPGDRIKISKIISTQIACPQLEIENELRTTLEMVDNYSINGTKLTLNKAKMAPLARFEAVYF